MFSVYKRLLVYVPEKKALVWSSVILSVASTFSIALAYYHLFCFFRDLLLQNDLTGSIAQGWYVFVFLIGGHILYFIGAIISHLLGFRLETNLRKRGLEGLVRASFSFFDKNSSGRIRRIIDDNAAETHSVIAHLLPDLASALVQPILIIVLAFIVDIKVGIILLVVMISCIVLYYKMSGQTRFLTYYQEALERMSSETVEYIRGIQVIKIFDASKSFKALYRAIDDYAKFALQYSMSCKVPWVIMQWAMFAIAAILTVVIYALPTVFSPDAHTAVSAIMTMFLAGVMFSTINKIMYFVMNAMKATMAIDKLESLYTAMHEDNVAFGTEEHFDNFDISFEDVTFGYGEKKVIEGLSFTLQERHSYALVGASGSGKSTIAKLISGFYKLDSGHIKIGGKDISSYSEKALLDHIAFVFQDVKLFKTTIYENVALADRSASREQVMDAIEKAGLRQVIDKLPQKEETLIGAKGIYLSGGERQRVGIARALLKPASIVIMDEASAAVDPENEHEVQKALSELIKDKTVIMIAHRLSSIRDVDEILVIEDGKIIERGTDEELSSRSGKYKYYLDLYNSASEWRL